MKLEDKIKQKTEIKLSNEKKDTTPYLAHAKKTRLKLIENTMSKNNFKNISLGAFHKFLTPNHLCNAYLAYLLTSYTKA